MPSCVAGPVPLAVAEERCDPLRGALHGRAVQAAADTSTEQRLSKGFSA
jgi:hypothetical protein